jgi:membrane protein DedA with SNARE-associated domain
MQAFLINLTQNHAFWVYFVIIVLACAEGPILSMIFGVIIKLGYVHLLPIYASLMVGDLIGDVVWYYLGHHFGMRFVRRFGKYFSIEQESIGKVSRVFHKYKHPILFISKISNGFGFALVTLFTAGMVGIPFFLYMVINLVGQFIWTGLLLAVGYFLGDWYLAVDSALGKLGVVALGVVVLFAFFGYRKYLSKKAETMVI